MSGGVNGGTPTEWLRGQKSLPEWHIGAGKFFSGAQVNTIFYNGIQVKPSPKMSELAQLWECRETSDCNYLYVLLMSSLGRLAVWFFLAKVVWLKA
jgi:hypothetical protein